MADNEKKPLMLFIAGGNGAGKSSLWDVVKSSAEFSGFEYLNVDDKFKELKGQNPAATFKEASDWRNAEIGRLLTERKSFVVETVFDAGKLGFLKKAKANGFETAIYFMGIDSPDLAVERVNFRHSVGGHHIPEETVRRKWADSLDVAEKAITRSDYMRFFDNSVIGAAPRHVASIEHGVVTYLAESKPSWLAKIPTMDVTVSGVDREPPAAPPPSAGQSKPMQIQPDRPKEGTVP
jgi:predicted ABC-type ATPase